MLLMILAKYFWHEMDKIDAMPCRNIDELCAKADAMHKLEVKFNKLPVAYQIAIGISKRSDVL